PAVGAERQGVNIAEAAEKEDFPAGRHVPHLHALKPSRGQPRAVRTEYHLRGPANETFEVVQLLTDPCIPDLHPPIVPHPPEPRPVGTERHAPNRLVTVSGEGTQRLAGRRIPDHQGSFRAHRDEPGAIETQRPILEGATEAVERSLFPARGYVPHLDNRPHRI